MEKVGKRELIVQTVVKIMLVRLSEHEDGIGVVEILNSDALYTHSAAHTVQGHCSCEKGRISFIACLALSAVLVRPQSFVPIWYLARRSTQYDPDIACE